MPVSAPLPYKKALSPLAYYKRITERLKRHSFAPLWFVIIFVMAVTALLVLMYPKKRLDGALISLNKPDAVARQYLHEMSQTEQDGLLFQLLLVKQDLQAGDIEQVVETLTPLVQKKPRSALSWQMLFLYVSAVTFQTFSVPPGDAQRIANTEILQQKINILAYGPLALDQQVFLVEVAAAVEQKEAANYLLTKIYQQQSKLTAVQKVALAKEALSIGFYEWSAQYYFATLKNITDIDQYRDYYLNALKSLEAGSMKEKALMLGEQYLGMLANDKTTLLFLTRLALAANRPDLAQKYIKQVLY